MDFASISLENLVSGLKKEEIDLFNYLASACTLIETYEKDVQALLPEKNRFDRLYEDGKRLKEKFPEKKYRPPLYGALFGVKDIINANGFPTKAGSKLPPHLFEGPEAPIVKKIKDAGGIILGKTVTTEFAFLDPGPTRNPLNVKHTPGGSSSGSAAAVAAGYCPLAIGTQTIGSVIRPAAFCGITGYKPSQGLIANEGIVPLAKTMDQVGFFTRRIEDMELIFSSIVDNQRAEGSNYCDTLKIGVQQGAYLDQASPDIVRDFMEIVELLGERIQVKAVDILEGIEEVNESLFELIAAEKALTHKSWFSEFKDLYSSKITESIAKGLKIDNNKLERTRQYRQEFKADLERKMIQEGIVAVLSPATAEYPPKTLKSTGNPIMNAPWTFAGFPVLNIPVTKRRGLFPLSLQIVCLPMSDQKLFRIAQSISRTLT